MKSVIIFFLNGAIFLLLIILVIITFVIVIIKFCWSWIIKHSFLIIRWGLLFLLPFPLTWYIFWCNTDIPINSDTIAVCEPKEEATQWVVDQEKIKSGFKYKVATFFNIPFDLEIYKVCFKNDSKGDHRYTTSKDAFGCMPRYVPVDLYLVRDEPCDNSEILKTPKHVIGPNKKECLELDFKEKYYNLIDCPLCGYLQSSVLPIENVAKPLVENQIKASILFLIVYYSILAIVGKFFPLLFPRVIADKIKSKFTE